MTGDPSFIIQIAVFLLSLAATVMLPLLVWVITLCVQIKNAIDNWEPPHRPERPGKPTT